MWQEGNLPRRMWLAAQRTAHSRPSTSRPCHTAAPLCCISTRTAGSRPGCAAALHSAVPLSQPLPCIRFLFLPVPLLAPLLTPLPCIPTALSLFQRQSGRRGRGGRRWRGDRCSGSFLPLQQQAFASAAAGFCLCSGSFLPLQRQFFTSAAEGFCLCSSVGFLCGSSGLLCLAHAQPASPSAHHTSN